MTGAPLDEPESISKMLGYFFREAGTLTMVFAPVDMVFDPGKARMPQVVTAMLVGTALLIVGITIERSRR